jgi:hypothetical protein
MFGLEAVQCSDRIRRDPENVGSNAAECAFESRKIDSLKGTAAGIGSGIKVQNELASGEVCKPDRPTAVPRQPEAGALAPSAGLARFAAFAGLPETARGACFLAMCLPFDAFGSEFSG